MATYRIKAPQVVPKITVGAGDSILACIVYGLSLDMGLRECQEHRIAFGTATGLQSGTANVHKKMLKNYVQKQ